MVQLRELNVVLFAVVRGARWSNVRKVKNVTSQRSITHFSVFICIGSKNAQVLLYDSLHLR